MSTLSSFGISWILILDVILSCHQSQGRKIDKTNWTAKSRYHFGDVEPCDTHNCSKPPTLDNSLLTWLGDGPQDCYGNKVRYVCHCEEDTEVDDVHDDVKDAYFERWRRRIAHCQSHGGWSVIAGHENRCDHKHCDAPKKRDRATYNVTKLIPVHPDVETPDLKSKFCPGTVVQHICNECYAGGGTSECMENTDQYSRGGTWSHDVTDCKKIPGCKTCEAQTCLCSFCIVN